MEKIGKMFEGGQQVRKLLLETCMEQGGMDRAAMVFGMVELIIDLKPEDKTMEEWQKMVAGVFNHFAQEKQGQHTKQ